MNALGQLSKPASFMSTEKITGVPTVNMKMVVMGDGDLVGGEIAKHRGSYTVANKTVMNMKINDDSENKALKDMMGPTGGGSLPILQSSGGGIAYQDVETNTLKPYAGGIQIPPELSSIVGMPAGTTIPCPDPAVFEGDYLNIYIQGIGILLEYYH